MHHVFALVVMLLHKLVDLESGGKTQLSGWTREEVSVIVKSFNGLHCLMTTMIDSEIVAGDSSKQSLERR